METVNGVNGDKGTGQPPPSPLTGCYLLIVIGEAHSQQHKDIILQRIAKGLLSWDMNECLVDLEKELAIITEQGLEGEEARYGERLIQFASENLVTEILIHPVVSTLAQCMRNLLSSFTRHRHIIHSGYTFAANGSWALQDGTFSLADFSEAFQEIEVQRVIRAYENGISMDIHCSPEGDWTRLPKESFTKACKVRVNPTDVLTSGSPAITGFVNYVEPFLVPTSLENLLESSDVVGNIRFSRPTLYVFPGGQGDAALFGINGFNMLLDGGFARKACFWDFVRHLDRLDAVLMTRLNNSNVGGISSVLRRKRQDALYPQIGHFFCNLQERKALLSPDGDKDKDPLLINLLEEGHEIISNLRHLHLTPQVCYRDSEPINLYHKVGHGTLDMYVLSPAKDSREVREFLQKWNQSDQKLFANIKSSREFTFPIQNLISIAALLVWQPANPNDTITRILIPGSCPQKKIFEGLERLKHLEFLKHPVCTEKSLMPVTFTKKTVKESIIEKVISKEKVHMEKKENKLIEENIVAVNGDVIKEKIVKKSDSTESERSTKTKKAEESKIIENGEKPKPKPKPPKPRSDSQHRRRTIEKKASPTTPKKTVENGDLKKPTKPSPAPTPAKSAKDESNRKVIESKAKKESMTKPVSAPPEPKPKVERKPISRRPKGALKAPISPVKKLVNGIQKPDSISRKGKLDKEGTTDSSTVSTPSADQDSILKKDITKLTPEEIQQLKAQELADLKEEQEAVKEIEAVFRKGETRILPADENMRIVKEISIDEKLEKDEYLIIEKEEIEHDSLDEREGKEDETQKLARDSEESEKHGKKRKLSDEEVKVKHEELKEEVNGILIEAEQVAKTVGEQIVTSKVSSPEEKVDVSDKKATDKEAEEEKDVVESQPDEKVSVVRSGDTTTAPTLPEDERIPLDEIKEDNGAPIEEKYVKEETKEKEIPVIQLHPKPPETVAKLPSVAGIRLDKQTHIRDIVKTPDEVADLPVHEEADLDYAQDIKTETVKTNEITEERKDIKVSTGIDKEQLKDVESEKDKDEVGQVPLIEESRKSSIVKEELKTLTDTVLKNELLLKNDILKETEKNLTNDLETDKGLDVLEKAELETKEKQEKIDITKEEKLEPVPVEDKKSEEEIQKDEQIEKEGIPVQDKKPQEDLIKGKVSPSEKVVSPSKKAVSPSKEAVSPSKESVSPSKEAVIPSMEAVSPSKEAISSPEQVVSPSKGATSPSKEAVSPTKEAVSSPKEVVSPSKGAISPSKEAVSPTKEAVSSPKEVVSPSEKAISPSKEAASPIKEAVIPSIESVSLSKEAISSPKEVVSPLKEAVIPLMEAVSPSKEAVSSPKEVVSPSKEAGIPLMEAVSPSKEAVSSPKEVVSPSTKAISPSKEAVSPVKESVSQSQEAVIPSKEAVSPTKEVVSSPKEVVSPSKEAVSPSKESVSPSKEGVIPSKEAASPSKEPVSSPKEVLSPSKKAISPSKETVSPSKEDVVLLEEVVSLSKETASPSKETVSPLKQSISQSEEAVIPSKEAVSPSKEPVSSPKEVVSPSKKAISPLKETVSPSKEDVAPSEEVASLSKETASLLEKLVSPSEEAVSPPRETISPSKEVGSSPKETDSPSKEAISPSKEVISSSAEAISPSKEAVSSPKEDVIPSKEAISPSKEVMSPSKGTTPSKEAVSPLTEKVSSPKQAVSPTIEAISAPKETLSLSIESSLIKEEIVSETSETKGSPDTGKLKSTADDSFSKTSVEQEKMVDAEINLAITKSPEKARKDSTSLTIKHESPTTESLLKDDTTSIKSPTKESLIKETLMPDQKDELILEDEHDSLDKEEFAKISSHKKEDIVPSVDEEKDIQVIGSEVSPAALDSPVKKISNLADKITSPPEKSSSPSEKPVSPVEKLSSPLEKSTDLTEKSTTPEKMPTSPTEKVTLEKDTIQSEKSSAEKPSSLTEISVSPQEKVIPVETVSAEKATTPVDESTLIEEKPPSIIEKTISPQEPLESLSSGIGGSEIKSSSPAEKSPSPTQQQTSIMERTASPSEKTSIPVKQLAKDEPSTTEKKFSPEEMPLSSSEQLTDLEEKIIVTSGKTSPEEKEKESPTEKPSSVDKKRASPEEKLTIEKAISPVEILSIDHVKPTSPEKKPTSFPEKIVSPVSPLERSTTPTKQLVEEKAVTTEKSITPKEDSLGTVDKVITPVKESTTPGKEATSPIKQLDTLSEIPSSIGQKETGPEEKSTSPTEKITTGIEKAISPVKQLADEQKMTTEKQLILEEVPSLEEKAFSAILKPTVVSEKSDALEISTDSEEKLGTPKEQPVSPTEKLTSASPTEKPTTTAEEQATPEKKSITLIEKSSHEKDRSSPDEKSIGFVETSASLSQRPASPTEKLTTSESPSSPKEISSVTKIADISPTEQLISPVKMAKDFVEETISTEKSSVKETFSPLESPEKKIGSPDKETLGSIQTVGPEQETEKISPTGIKTSQKEIADSAEKAISTEKSTLKEIRSPTKSPEKKAGSPEKETPGSVKTARSEQEINTVSPTGIKAPQDKTVTPEEIVSTDEEIQASKEIISTDKTKVSPIVDSPEKKTISLTKEGLVTKEETEIPVSFEKKETSSQIDEVSQKTSSKKEAVSPKKIEDTKMIDVLEKDVSFSQVKVSKGSKEETIPTETIKSSTAIHPSEKGAASPLADEISQAILKSTEEIQISPTKDDFTSDKTEVTPIIDSHIEEEIKRSEPDSPKTGEVASVKGETTPKIIKDSQKSPAHTEKDVPSNLTELVTLDEEKCITTTDKVSPSKIEKLEEKTISPERDGSPKIASPKHEDVSPEVLEDSEMKQTSPSKESISHEKREKETASPLQERLSPVVDELVEETKVKKESKQVEADEISKITDKKPETLDRAQTKVTDQEEDETEVPSIESVKAELLKKEQREQLDKVEDKLSKHKDEKTDHKSKVEDASKPETKTVESRKDIIAAEKPQEEDQIKSQASEKRKDSLKDAKEQKDESVEKAAIEKEEKVLEIRAEDIKETFEAVEDISKSVAFEKCRKMSETEKEEKFLEREAKDIKDTFEIIEDMTKSVAFEKCIKLSETEKEEQFLEREAKDIRDTFETIEDMTKSVAFEKCRKLSETEEQEKYLEKESKDIKDTFETIQDMTKSVAFEKCHVSTVESQIAETKKDTQELDKVKKEMELTDTDIPLTKKQITKTGEEAKIDMQSVGQKTEKDGEEEKSASPEIIKTDQIVKETVKTMETVTTGKQVMDVMDATEKDTSHSEKDESQEKEKVLKTPDDKKQIDEKSKIDAKKSPDVMKDKISMSDEDKEVEEINKASVSPIIDIKAKPSGKEEPEIHLEKKISVQSKTENELGEVVLDKEHKSKTADDLRSEDDTMVEKEEEKEKVESPVKTELAKIEEKTGSLKKEVMSEQIEAHEVILTDGKEKPSSDIETVESTVEIKLDETEEIERISKIDKLELGRKSPKEREEDVIKIVATVAEVLKSDAPLEEFEGKLPISPTYSSYTTELRETHITTQDSPAVDNNLSKSESIHTIEEERHSDITQFLEEEKKASGAEADQPKKPEDKRSNLIKESQELMMATTKMISDIKLSQTEDKLVEQSKTELSEKLEEEIEDDLTEKLDEETGGTVHRMLVTASSEDGGEEIEICPVGSITFSRSSESSGRSSPEQSQKLSQKSSLVDTISDSLSTVRQITSEKDSGIDDAKSEGDQDDQPKLDTPPEPSLTEITVISKTVPSAQTEVELVTTVSEKSSPDKDSVKSLASGKSTPDISDVEKSKEITSSCEDLKKFGETSQKDSGVDLAKELSTAEAISSKPDRDEETKQKIDKQDISTKIDQEVLELLKKEIETKSPISSAIKFDIESVKISDVTEKTDGFETTKDEAAKAKEKVQIDSGFDSVTLHDKISESLTEKVEAILDKPQVKKEDEKTIQDKLEKESKQGEDLKTELEKSVIVKQIIETGTYIKDSKDIIEEPSKQRHTDVDKTKEVVGDKQTGEEKKEVLKDTIEGSKLIEGSEILPKDKTEERKDSIAPSSEQISSVEEKAEKIEDALQSKQDKIDTSSIKEPDELKSAEKMSADIQGEDILKEKEKVSAIIGKQSEDSCKKPEKPSKIIDDERSQETDIKAIETLPKVSLIERDIILEKVTTVASDKTADSSEKPGVKELATKTVEIVEDIIKVTETPTEHVVATVSDAKGDIEKFLDEGSEKLKKTVDEVKDHKKDEEKLVDQDETVLAKPLETVEKMSIGISDKKQEIQDFIDKEKEHADEVMESLIAKTEKKKDSLADGLEASLLSLKDDVKDSVTEVKEDIKRAEEHATDSVVETTEIVSEVKGGLFSAFGSIIEKAGEIIQKVTKEASDLTQKTSKDIEDSKESVVKDVEKTAEKISDHSKSVKESINDEIREIIGDAEQQKDKVVKSLDTSLKETVGSLEEKAESIKKSVTDLSEEIVGKTSDFKETHDTSVEHETEKITQSDRKELTTKETTSKKDASEETIQEPKPKIVEEHITKEISGDKLASQKIVTEDKATSLATKVSKEVTQKTEEEQKLMDEAVREIIEKHSIDDSDEKKHLEKAKCVVKLESPKDGSKKPIIEPECVKVLVERRFSQSAEVEVVDEEDSEADKQDSQDTEERLIEKAITKSEAQEEMAVEKSDIQKEITKESKTTKADSVINEGIAEQIEEAITDFGRSIFGTEGKIVTTKDSVKEVPGSQEQETEDASKDTAVKTEPPSKSSVLKHDSHGAVITTTSDIPEKSAGRKLHESVVKEIVTTTVITEKIIPGDKLAHASPEKVVTKMKDHTKETIVRKSTEDLKDTSKLSDALVFDKDDKSPSEREIMDEKEAQGEERYLEKSADQLKDTFEAVEKMARSISFEKCRTLSETEKEEKILEQRAEDIGETFETVEDIAKTVSFEKCRKPSESEIEESFLVRKADDISDTFTTVDDMTKSMDFEKCHAPSSSSKSTIHQEEKKLEDAETFKHEVRKDAQSSESAEVVTKSDDNKKDEKEKSESEKERYDEKADKHLECRDKDEPKRETCKAGSTVETTHMEYEITTDNKGDTTDVPVDTTKSSIFEKCERETMEKGSSKSCIVKESRIIISGTLPSQHDTQFKEITSVDSKLGKDTFTLEPPDSQNKKLSISEVEITLTGKSDSCPQDISSKILESERINVEKYEQKTEIKETVASDSVSIKQTISVSIAGPSTTAAVFGIVKSIGEVEEQKELRDTLLHEKHIPGSVTPPTAPVSPNVIEDHHDKDSYSDISKAQADSEKICSDEEDRLSVTSEAAHSRDSSYYEFEVDKRADPMSMSFYGALPSESEMEPSYLYEITRAKYSSVTSDEGDTDPTDGKRVESDVMTSSFIGELPSSSADQHEELVSGLSTSEKGKKDPIESWGKPLGLPAPRTQLYELTNAKYSSSSAMQVQETAQSSSNDDDFHHNPHYSQMDLMTASFYSDFPTNFDSEKDPIRSWGKPLGLPSPAPPTDNKGTPKKERRLPANVTAKNKLNDDKKRADSPSKFNKNKKVNPIYMDLTYVPHHGNSYYAYVDFFKRIRARYYVFSGIEPSREVYSALLEAKQTWEDKDLEVTIIPTYDTDTLGYWVADNEELLAKYKIDLSPSASRCTINLQDHETSCSAYRLEF